MTSELHETAVEKPVAPRHLVPAWATSDRISRFVVLGGLTGLAAGFYVWTVNTSGGPIVFGQSQGDPYNQLANAFLRGHLYLLTKPPAALLRLKNPYSPLQNSAIVGPFHDFALYDGHFYLTWGPTALVLFISWRILGEGDLTQSLSIVIFSTIGLAFAVLLLCFLVRTYMNNVRLWKLGVATIALALSSVTPYLMRRPSQYEVEIACAYCFVFAGLYGLVSGTFGPRRRPVRTCAGSLCIGLAALSREDLILLVAFPVALAVREWLSSGRAPPRDRWRATIVLVVPVCIMLAVIFAYNSARFGSPFQFGTAYQLASIDQRHNFVYQPSSILPGLFYYFVEPVQFSLGFPYLIAGPPPSYPWPVANYEQSASIVSVLSSTPILMVLFAAPFLLRRRLERPLGWLMAGFVVAGLAIAIALSFGIAATNTRYEVDFASLLLIPSCICWLALSQGSRWYRRALSVVGTVLLLGGALVGVALSITGPYDELRAYDSAQYNELATATSFIPTAITKLMGHPDIVKVVNFCGNGTCGTYEAGLSHLIITAATLEVDVISPSGGWFLSVEVFPTDKGEPAEPFSIQLDATTWHYRTAGGAHYVFIPLHEGFDRLYFTVPGNNPVSFYTLRTVRHVAAYATTPSRAPSDASGHDAK